LATVEVHVCVFCPCNDRQLKPSGAVYRSLKINRKEQLTNYGESTDPDVKKNKIEKINDEKGGEQQQRAKKTQSRKPYETYFSL